MISDFDLFHNFLTYFNEYCFWISDSWFNLFSMFDLIFIFLKALFLHLNQCLKAFTNNQITHLLLIVIQLTFYDMITGYPEFTLYASI